MKTLELIEQASFSMSGSEGQSIRVDIRAGKIAEEIIAEYSPFKEMVAGVDVALENEQKTIISKKKEDQIPKQNPRKNRREKWNLKRNRTEDNNRTKREIHKRKKSRKAPWKRKRRKTKRR